MDIRSDLRLRRESTISDSSIFLFLSRISSIFFILPALTFNATYEAVVWNGLKPEIIDVFPSDGLIYTPEIEEHITENTSAILAVDLYGASSFSHARKKIAKKHHLELFFDS